MGVVALGEARPSLLPAFLSSPALSPLRLDPDFLRGPNAGGARPSLRSAPDPSRDIPGRLLRNVPMACADMSGEAARLRMSKLVRPSDLQGSFLLRNSLSVSQPPPTRTMTVLRRIRSRRSFCESPNRYFLSATLLTSNLCGHSHSDTCRSISSWICSDSVGGFVDFF